MMQQTGRSKLYYTNVISTGMWFLLPVQGLFSSFETDLRDSYRITKKITVSSPQST